MTDEERARMVEELLECADTMRHAEDVLKDGASLTETMKTRDELYRDFHRLRDLARKLGNEEAGILKRIARTLKIYSARY